MINLCTPLARLSTALSVFAVLITPAGLHGQAARLLQGNDADRAHALREMHRMLFEHAAAAPDQLTVELLRPLLDSIAVNGCDLTAVYFDEDGFHTNVIEETYNRTNLGDLKVGDPVNLERALTLAGRIGGHLVRGVIEHTGTLRATEPQEHSVVAWFNAPAEIMRYVIVKGEVRISRDVGGAGIVVVGASLAGLRAAEELRARGYTGPVTMVGDEAHRPYDRPPLSKQVLAGTWEPERIALAVAHAEGLDGLALEWRLGTRAAGLDLEVSRGKARLFSEIFVADWEAPLVTEDLSAWGGYVEGRWDFLPAWHGVAPSPSATFA